ncbi:MAG: hypothetical protein BWY28_00948 [bacterium ADurb.Bin236]|nr:MAG: hypothetical protein BWY28_00948 [bacterium ADurb.Bin236]
METNPAAHRRERVARADNFERVLEATFGNKLHIPLAAYVGRAGTLAWRRPLPLDGEPVGDRLRIEPERGPEFVQIFVRGIRYMHRTHARAFSATCAFPLVYKPRPLVHRDVEPAGFSFNLLHIRHSDYVDVRMVADRDQLGRDNAHGAVVGGKHFVKPHHVAADAGLICDHVNLKTAVGQIERRLHGRYAAADNHYRPDLFASRFRFALLLIDVLFRHVRCPSGDMRPPPRCHSRFSFFNKGSGSTRCFFSQL